VPGVKTNEIAGTRAVLRHYRMSAYKARQVLDLVRGRDVDRAEEMLRATPREAARVVAKVLASAVANARNNDQLDPEELYISACFADEGTTLKRWRPRARGRATRIRKRTCHITVIVSRLPEDRLERRRARQATAPTGLRSRRVAASRRGGAGRVAGEEEVAGTETVTSETVEFDELESASAETFEAADDAADEEGSGDESESVVTDAGDATDVTDAGIDEQAPETAEAEIGAEVEIEAEAESDDEAPPAPKPRRARTARKRTPKAGDAGAAGEEEKG
jgi:large subunit ribosomal protein L22